MFCLRVSLYTVFCFSTMAFYARCSAPGDRTAFSLRESLRLKLSYSSPMRMAQWSGLSRRRVRSVATRPGLPTGIGSRSLQSGPVLLGDLFRVHPDGTGLERLTGDAEFDDQAAFSPDGGNSLRHNTCIGLRQPLDSRPCYSQNRASHHKIGCDVRPAWSPDGKWIAFSSDRGSSLPMAKGSMGASPTSGYLSHSP